MRLTSAFGIGVPLLSAVAAGGDPDMGRGGRRCRCGSARARPTRRKLMIDLWNATHEDKIELTVIPDNQVVTKLATSVQAGDVPDLMSFDLIYMPDFMKAGFLIDLTDQLKDDPNQAKVAKAFKDLATYEASIYGTGFLPDVSILLWNKDLFKQAGLDPEKPPTTIDEIHEMREEDPRPRPRHLRLLLLRLLRRLQHLRHLAGMMVAGGA